MAYIFAHFSVYAFASSVGLERAVARHIRKVCIRKNAFTSLDIMLSPPFLSGLKRHLRLVNGWLLVQICSERKVLLICD
jgi:hypothetical protein